MRILALAFPCVRAWVSEGFKFESTVSRVRAFISRGIKCDTEIMELFSNTQILFFLLFQDLFISLFPRVALAI